jgi:hypothetical protein
MCYRDFRYIQTVICIMITACIASACSPMLFSYKGDKVTQKNRMILLKQGEQKGEWKTDEVSVTYHYQLAPEALKISGTTELVGGIKIGFRWIKQLDVYLLFLDKQGTVIESPLVFSAGSRAIDAIPMNFETTIPVPEGIHTISFAYAGELTGTGGPDSASLSISDSPSRP